ncbi:MAG: N4-gp56 family major capsid protein [Anaerotignum sp.]|nr:N4-gp56 family major capsid protein [Anaerotignum sp.]
MNTYTMNLQLFDVMTTSTETLSAEMKTFYDSVLLDNAKPNLVHDQFGQKRPIPKNNGKQIEFRRYTSLEKALTPLTEGVTPDPNSLKVTTVTATVEQYGDWISMSDVLLLTAIDNNLAEAVQLLGDQAGRTLDTITRDIINGGTNVLYAPNGTDAVTSRGALTANAHMTAQLVMKAAAILKGANASTFDNDFVAIIHPYVAYDLMQDEGWKELHKYCAPENAFEGELGKLGRVRFVESTEAKVWGEAGASKAAVFSTLVIGKNAYGVTEVEGGGLETIVKQKGSAGTADPLDQRASAGWKAIKTAEILSEEFMVRIESSSSFSTAESN